MIANTYVVKPFGISEVKVIALKGEPGGPTQEQVNAAVEEYMDDHPEAQIPDGAVTTEKLASNAVAPYADNLVSSSYVSDSEPYLFRKTFAGVREDTEIVGGSVVFNQLFVAQARASASGVAISKVDNNTIRIYGTATGTVWQQMTNTGRPTVGHKYLADKGSDSNLYAFTNDNKGIAVGVNSRYTIGNPTTNQYMYINVGNGTTIDIEVKPMLIDLTLMFGSTVADYIYSLETATAGAGVAFFRSLFNKPYYAYNAGTLISVNTSGHKMTSPDEETVTYPLSSIDLRGIPTIVDGKLKYDGDIRKSDGTVERRYGLDDLGTLNWVKSGTIYYARVPAKENSLPNYLLMPRYQCLHDNAVNTTSAENKLTNDKSAIASKGSSNPYIYIRDDGQTDAESLKESLGGVSFVYLLATPTTETTDPYTNPQKCYPDGTEEYIDTRDVPIPVGHNTKYMRDLKKLLEGIPDAPTASGTYVLKATVSASGVTYAWIAG